MTTRRSIPAVAALFLLAAGLSGCVPVIQGAAEKTVDQAKEFVPSSNLHAHAVPSIKQVKINRIAVMPVASDVGPEVIVADGGPEAVTAELYSQAAIAGGWEVTAQDDVTRAMQKLPPTTPANLDENALKLGHELSVDGVLYGELTQYKERVGLDYAAQAPASVAFTLKFVDMASKQIIWSAKFAKQQKSLSQNFLDLVNFVQQKARWVRAHEIAQEGVQEAVNNLHKDLNLTANVERFETGTYEQLKSGQQRYNGTVRGIY